MKIYKFLLWFWGFAEGERISFMLRRQKQRLGIFWWLGIAGFSSFWVWLVLHILEIL